jgi:hypothetical protein
LFAACPPPYEKLNFKVGNNLYIDEIIIKSGLKHFKLTGYYFVWTFGETNVTIKIELDEADSLNEEFCEDFLSWEGEKYILEYVSKPSKNICKYYFKFEHRAFRDMRPSRFEEYLENTNLKIKVPMTADNYDEIEIVLDKVKLRETYERVQERAQKK